MAISPHSSADVPRNDALAAVQELEKRFSGRSEVNPQLTRALVSFQANKAEPVFRWFKYREGFSRDLVDYCLNSAAIVSADRVLDPFAGTGATLFTAADKGCDGLGIELMPVGITFMNFRKLIGEMGSKALLSTLDLIDGTPWKYAKAEDEYPYLRITAGAFPKETETDLRKFRVWISDLPKSQQQALDFLVFSSLEEISYTRKDGQYLRWDYRAGRTRSTKKFYKGDIPTLEAALNDKIQRIRADLSMPESPTLFETRQDSEKAAGHVEVLLGSNFVHLANIEESSFDFSMTSPPYCNRYDYTRTYALELAHLGLTDQSVSKLRQDLLTCTVENREKDLSFLGADILSSAKIAVDSSKALQAILVFLEAEIQHGLLNNRGIRTMVSGYFFELAVHIAQMARILTPGSHYVMVNDNVQYNGVSVPVDCILSEIAESLGFSCEKIWVLPTGKGNSSQQMKRHGRVELRKCVYSWKLN